MFIYRHLFFLVKNTTKLVANYAKNLLTKKKLFVIMKSQLKQ